MTKQFLNDLVYQVNGAAIEVHKALGPGLLESVYHRCMIHELKTRNIKIQSEVIIPVDYKGLVLDAELRCDLLVEDSLVVEFIAVESVLPIHVAQLITYMKLLKLPMGLLINFNTTHIFKEGQKTYVNEFFRELK